MTTPPSFEAHQTAVLAMDCQSGIVSLYAKPHDDLIGRAAETVKLARIAGMSVIHVQVGFRTGLLEVSGRNKLFAALKSSSQHQTLFEGTAGRIHPALGPEPTDIVVTKHCVSGVQRNGSGHDPPRE